MTTCSGCGREIIFITMISGKKMPCEPEAEAFSLGGDKVYITADGRTVRGKRWMPGDDTKETGHRPHWQSCPAADTFRGRKR